MSLASLSIAALALPTLVTAASSFNPLEHLGAQSPYFDAPVRGIAIETPPGCKVDQAAYILRHGARHPEPGSANTWLNFYNKIQNTTFTARGPLAFLGSWVSPIDDAPHQPLYLTNGGAGEAFALGRELRNRYGFTKNGESFIAWAADQQRCLDTGNYWIRGYLSAGNYLSAPEKNTATLISFPDSVNYTSANSLTPSAACPNYEALRKGDLRAYAFRDTYQPAIVKRLNKMLDGLVLTQSDIGTMQDLCGYQAGMNNDTRFCDVFKKEEWLDFEYAHDLNYFYGSGPANALSATSGYPYVKAIRDLFIAGPNKPAAGASYTPPPLVMSFTHDNNLPPVLSALGIWTKPLAFLKREDDREFRSSYVVSFRGTIALERLTCGEPLGDSVHHIAGQLGPANPPTKFETYVRVRVNNAPVAIPGCTSGPGSTCPLAAFDAYVTKQADVAGDFVEKCGLKGVPGATSEMTFLRDGPADKTATTRVLSPVLSK